MPNLIMLPAGRVKISELKEVVNEIVAFFAVFQLCHAHISSAVQTDDCVDCDDDDAVDDATPINVAALKHCGICGGSRQCSCATPSRSSTCCWPWLVADVATTTID